MSKKIEVTSCFYCPNYSTYEHDGSVYDTGMAMCNAYADGDNVVGRVFEYKQISGYMWEECPLEDYHAEAYDFKESVPVINKHALKAAYGLKEYSPLRQEYDAHISRVEPEQVTPAPVEMKELVATIDYGQYTETYFAGDGNYYSNHPSKLNHFIQGVSVSGGNIISITPIPTNSVLVYYSVPVGTQPISV